MNNASATARMLGISISLKQVILWKIMLPPGFNLPSATDGKRQKQYNHFAKM